MKIEKLKSRIIKYRLHGDDGEVIYFTLDLDKYELSISGETSASYKWFETPEHESFIELMLRCDKWYLCDKLFSEVFDIESTIKNIKKELEESEDFFEEDLEEIFEELDQIEGEFDESAFVICVENLLHGYIYSNFLDYCNLYECIEKKYRHWDEKAIDHFCKYIKPELKKELENEVTENEISFN